MDIEEGMRVTVGGAWLDEEATVLEVAEHAEPTLYRVQDVTGYTEWVTGPLAIVTTTREGK